MIFWSWNCQSRLKICVKWMSLIAYVPNLFCFQYKIIDSSMCTISMYRFPTVHFMCSVGYMSLNVSTRPMQSAISDSMFANFVCRWTYDDVTW